MSSGTTATTEELAAGERLFRRPWHFVRGAPTLDVLPSADRPEVAFAGRSNVGKSSLINGVVGRKGLARTSNTPGRTQELNFFATPDIAFHLVDLPGYGFAQAPKEKVAAWTQTVRDYLRGRPTLARVFLLVDARHGLKPVDRTIMAVLNEAAVSFMVVLTKADKIGGAALERVLADTGDALAAEAAAYPQVLATSAVTGQGLPDLRAAIARTIAVYEGKA
ncbi:MAG: ribosome biogenesis GTP-binding protein YihA/YsxC [Hyphomicrobiaceae bacterium]